MGVEKAHGKREEKRRYSVGFKNKYYENDSCSLLMQTCAVNVVVLFLGLS